MKGDGRLFLPDLGEPPLTAGGLPAAVLQLLPRVSKDSLEGSRMGSWKDLSKVTMLLTPALLP